MTDLIKGLMLPALLIAPLLGAAIWASVGQGLRPLRQMARDLVERARTTCGTSRPRRPPSR